MGRPGLAPTGKKRATENAHIALLDEAGVLLAPLVRRTYAPRGRTPILKQRARHRDKVSIMGGVVLSPKKHHPRLVFQTYPNDYVTSAKAARFVRGLLRQVPGKLIVVWDRGQMHKGEPIRQLLADHPRLTIEYLPPYAPDLNPAEHVWNHVKYQELANFTPHNVAEITAATHRVLQNAKADPERVCSFYRATPLRKIAHATLTI